MIKHYIYKALTLPPHVTVKKAASMIKRSSYEALRRRKDHKVSSYAAEYPNGKLLFYFPKLAVEPLLPYAETISGVTKHYLAHRFDLLGSGWVEVRHGMRCRGLEGYKYDMGVAMDADPEGRWLKERINITNLEESQRIWKLIFQSKIKTYTPIDWHLDFKSGCHWSESTWYKDIRYGHKHGVDVKVPWELARMQHLPQLAWAYTCAKEKIEGFEARNRYACEFRNQILDFIATNPPRFGVNWTCTMDVSIRVANMLVAYDLFRAFGMSFDQPFEAIFARSIYEHGQHIVGNLEWSEKMRSNHYLADIVGLLFVAAYLSRNREIDTWLAFAVQELVEEVKFQFYPDGTNFEASTSYHHLSSELVIYATALVLGLPEEKRAALHNYNHRLLRLRPQLHPAPTACYPLPDVKHPTSDNRRTSPFPNWYFERLEKMAEFSLHITKPNAQILQIGDNDSGHFLKLSPVWHRLSVAEAKARYANLEGYDDLPDDADYWMENQLDHRHLVAAINGLFGRKDFADFTGEQSQETAIIHQLSGGTRVGSYRRRPKSCAAEEVSIGTSMYWDRQNREVKCLPERQKQITEIIVPEGDLRGGMICYAYPDFGLYLFCSYRLYLAVRCGPVGQNGNGGHSHNDQLSIELNIDGEDLISDPGTYVYTPLPARRNEYRSVKSHFTPRFPGKEPADLSLGLFRLDDTAKAECLYFGEEGFIGRHWGNKSPLYRMVEIWVDRVRIIDWSVAGAPLVKPGKLNPSPGYGIALIKNYQNHKIHENG